VIERARDAFNAFVTRHDTAWELGMAALAVAYVAIGFASDAAPAGQAGTLQAVDTLLTGIFVAEFASRFGASRDRIAYLRGHWIDLVALVPVVRGARVLRLVRLLRLVRAFAGVFRALTHVQRLAGHRGLVWLFVSWMAVMVLSSLALYTAEEGVNSAISSPLDALWWGVVTLTTVGYGDVYPVTPEGRLAASVLMLLGIGLFSAITATVTSFMLGGSSAPSAAERLRALAALRDDGLISEPEFAERRGALLDHL